MLTAFLPCRANSQRVKKKNTRSFAGQEGGLAGIKLEQLARCAILDQVLLSTNDPEIISIAEGSTLAKNGKLRIDNRPDHLGHSSTSTDDLIRYAGEILDRGTVLWTHVTSPFLTEVEYAEMFNAYQIGTTQGYDSLMSVTRLQTFLWDEHGPVNYDPHVEKWPRTQTLNPLYEINSGAFFIEVEDMRRLNDRIGKRPHLHPLGHLPAFDIDTEDDFHLAEVIWAALKKPKSK